MRTIRYYAKKRLPENIYNELEKEIERQDRDMDYVPLFGAKGWLKECITWGESINGFKYWYDVDQKYVNKSGE